jgi:hypothetical protein
MRAAGILAMMFILLGSSALAAEVVIDDDRMAVVDGERAFILGLYENPKEDAVLEQLADAGFNLVRASANQESLDRLWERGLHAWLTTGYSIDLSSDADGRVKKLDKMVADFASHPALMVWEVPDEALWNCWYQPYTWRVNTEAKLQAERIEKLEDESLKAKLHAMQEESFACWRRGDIKGRETVCDAIWAALGEESPKPGLNLSDSSKRVETMAGGFLKGYQHLRQQDPAHPVWMNHAPRNQLRDLSLFNQAADIVGCDIYPAPWSTNTHTDLPVKTLAAVGAYTNRMQAASPTKPVWMVLQGCGWADLDANASEETIRLKRRPKFKETRFMAYDAVVHGARGILYWGTSYIEKDSEMWEDLLRVAKEMSDLQPVLSAPDADLAVSVEIGPTWASVEQAVEVLPKRVKGKTWFVVVNEYHEPLSYTITGMDALDGIMYSDQADAREVTVKHGSLTLTIGGLGVQILEPR